LRKSERRILRSARLGAKGKFTYYPENFTPNDDNRTLASKLGLDIKESLAAFKDHHIQKGDRSLDWNCFFNGWLRNERKFSPQRQEKKQVPMFDAVKAFRESR
jgi:hypothetical protein